VITVDVEGVSLVVVIFRVLVVGEVVSTIDVVVVGVTVIVS
jgi:hypothetical protein